MTGCQSYETRNINRESRFIEYGPTNDEWRFYGRESCPGALFRLRLFDGGETVQDGRLN